MRTFFGWLYKSVLSNIFKKWRILFSIYVPKIRESTITRIFIIYLQEIRRRRQETTVELRKNKRDDVLSKKRQTEGLTADSTDDEDLRENLSSARY